MIWYLCDVMNMRKKFISKKKLEEKDMFMTNAMKEAIDKAYERGYATGRAEHALEAFEDEKRRNEQLYKWAYEQGAYDALAKAEIIEIEDMENILKALKKED